MHVLACQRCGASLSRPDAYGTSWCAFCQTVHQAPQGVASALAAELLATAMVDRMTEEAACIPMTEDAILALLREHFAGADATYLAPAIPGKKEHGARRAHAGQLPVGERILALYDDTVFGSGEDGFVVTAQRLAWKNVADRSHAVEWRHIDPDSIFAEGRKLAIGRGRIELSGDESVIDACSDAFYVLALSARTAGTPAGAAPTTPPPPHTVSYPAYAAHASSQPVPAFACWHCATPLYWSTPQCARCGAWPSPQGWTRTA